MLKPVTKHAKKTEDLLPKVLVAGQPSDCMPRIIICDAMVKKQKKFGAGLASMQFRIPSGSSHPPGSNPPPAAGSPQQCCPPLPVEPPPTKPRSSRNIDRSSPAPPPRQPSNFDENSACSKLLLRMQSLRDEMSAMARQNEKMHQQLKGNNGIQKCRVQQSFPCSRPVTYPSDVEGRFQEYSKHTSILEKQIETMEQSVRCLSKQFTEAEKKHKEMDKARIHAQKMTETLECQKLEREPKLKCRDYCKGNCAKQTEKCTCSKPGYKCG